MALDGYYQEILGLHKAPFMPYVDGTFYYAFPSFVQRLQMLQQLIRGDDFLVLVIGDQGSGKTTLLNQFLASAGDKWRSCRIHAYSKTKSENTPLMENLNDHPAFILPDEQPPIVMFDDAHELTGIELQFLLQEALAPGSMNKLKRLVLFCEPSIQNTLATLTTPLAKETVVNKVYMSPIDETGTAEYLYHRLDVAGLTGKSPFQASDIKAIYRTSGGLPGEINKEAHRLLSKKYSKNSLNHMTWWMSVLLKNRPFHLAIAGMILMSLVVGLIFQNRISSYFAPKELPGSVAKIQKPSVIPTLSVAIKGDGKGDQELIKEEKKINKPKPVSLEKKAETSETEKAHGSVKGAEKPEKIMSGIHRENWILDQPSSHYTIQILGGPNEKSIPKFVEKYRFWNRVSYFQTKYKNKNWFSLLYGVYPTREAALSATKELPDEIHQFSPWVRRISSIHEEIKRNAKQ